MAWLRAIILSLLLAALGVGGWMAWQSVLMERHRTGDVIMLMPGQSPALNPFLPASEAERQLLDLLHEPLLRIDRQGNLGTALAEQWTWHQNMTCWFDSPTQVKQAAEAIAVQPAEKRAAWDLEKVTADGSSLVLRFAHPGSKVADEVMAVVAMQKPQPLTMLRVFLTPNQRSTIESFAKHREHFASTKRLWFDEDGSCELVTTRTVVQAQQAVMDWFRQSLMPVPEIRPLAELTALMEPVLDFRLKNTARWSADEPVTAVDVMATVAFVMQRPWPLSGRDAFRQIQSITEPEKGHLHIVYRGCYSMALPAWTGLPILQASWLKKHGQDFETQLPPGAGAWKISHRAEDRLTLEKSAEPTMPKIQVLLNQPDWLQELGVLLRSYDLLWPSAEQLEQLKTQPAWRLLPAPPHSQLMLVWQTESSALKDLQVREGLALALERESLRKVMPGGRARVHDSFFPPGLWFSETGAGKRYDLIEAEKRFTSAGFIRDVSGQWKKAGQPLHLRIITPAGNMDRQRLALALAASWMHFGISVQTLEVPPDRYVADLQNGQFDVAMLGGELTPGWDVLPLWHSSQRQGRGLNISRVADPQLDLLLEALVAELEPLQVPRRAAAVEARLAELRPALPLFTDVSEMAARQDRFLGLGDFDPARGITLRELLGSLQAQTRPTLKLEMLPPK